MWLLQLLNVLQEFRVGYPTQERGINPLLSLFPPRRSKRGATEVVLRQGVNLSPMSPIRTTGGTDKPREGRKQAGTNTFVFQIPKNSSSPSEGRSEKSSDAKE